jgi:hypothetical protein
MFGGDRPCFRQGAIPVPDQNTGPPQIAASGSFWSNLRQNQKRWRRGMGDTTAISWTDATFNPWIVCQHVSPGCDHCYVEAQNTFRKWTASGVLGSACARCRRHGGHGAIAWLDTRVAFGRRRSLRISPKADANTAR